MPLSLVYAIVLAAGQGRRFGRDKLLAPLRGRPVLGHVLTAVAGARDAGELAGGLVVLPQGNPDRERLLLNYRLEYAFNPAPERGVAGSLQTGLTTLASRHPGAEAALLVQGDQPLLRLDVISALISTWRRGTGPVVRPRYQEEPEVPGHPVLLDRSFWDRAGELKGDAGFAPLFLKYPDVVTLVDVPGNNPAINSPTDLALLESSTS
jgi:CTP:molybdopterin cytidylyltransferase MocA